MLYSKIATLAWMPFRQGAFIRLHPVLPVLFEKVINLGKQAFLYNRSRIKNKKQPIGLTFASNIYKEEFNKDSYRFVSKSPVKTINSMRVLLPASPKNSVYKQQRRADK